MSILHKSLGCLYVDSDGVVQFGFNGLPPRLVTGTELLVQNIIIRLFTTQESNAYSPGIGGNLYDIIGGGYAPGNEDLLREDFVNAFSAIETQIIEEQERQADLMPYERLRKITVASIEYSETTYTWNVQVDVLTAGGTTSTFLVNA